MLLSYSQGWLQLLHHRRCPPLLFGMSVPLSRPKGPSRLRKEAERKLRVDSAQILIYLELKLLVAGCLFLSFAEFLVQ